MCRLSWNLGTLTSSNPQGLFRLVRRLHYLLLLCDIFKFVMHYRIGCVCVQAPLLLLALKMTVVFALSIFKKRLVVRQNRCVSWHLQHVPWIFVSVCWILNAFTWDTQSHTYQYSCSVGYNMLYLPFSSLSWLLWQFPTLRISVSSLVATDVYPR